MLSAVWVIKAQGGRVGSRILGPQSAPHLGEDICRIRLRLVGAFFHDLAGPFLPAPRARTGLANGAGGIAPVWLGRSIPLNPSHRKVSLIYTGNLRRGRRSTPSVRTAPL